MRALRGAPGTHSEPHDHPRQRRRSARARADARGAQLRPTSPVESPRPASATCAIAAIGPKTAEQVKKEVGDLTKSGATKLIVDVRRTSGGALDDGLAIARLFVGKGTLAMREAQGRREADDRRRGGRRQHHAAGGAPHRHRHIRCRGAVCGRALRQSARRSDRRAHHRTRRRPETDQASGWQRPLAVDHALPHARAARRCTRRDSTRRSSSTSRTSNSVSRRRRPIPRSKKRSHASRRKRPRSQTRLSLLTFRLDPSSRYNDSAFAERALVSSPHRDSL